MVDDGSSDRTLEIIKRLASQDKRLIAVSHEKTGVWCGFKVGF